MAKSSANSENKEKPPQKNADLPLGVRRYDFRIARKLSQPQRIWLGGLHSRLAVNLTKAFEEIFHCETEIAFMGLEQMQGSNFQESGQEKVISSQIVLRPGNGRIYIIWPRAMAFFFIEKLLGGTGDELFIDKELSDFEKDILKRFTAITFRALQQAFEGKAHPEGECESILEGQESFSDILPYEILLIGSLNVRINGHQGKLTLIYPYSVVKLWVDDSTPSPEVTSMTSSLPRDGVTQGLAKAPLTVHVRMNSSKIKVADFTNLQVGDCLLFNHSIKEPFDVYIEQKLKFKGHLGLSGRQLGVKLVSRGYQSIQQEETAERRA